jgi:hypothetical protein
MIFLKINDLTPNKDKYGGDVQTGSVRIKLYFGPLRLRVILTSC